MSSPLSSLRRYSKLPLLGGMRKIKLSNSAIVERESDDGSSSNLLGPRLLQNSKHQSLPIFDHSTTSTTSQTPTVSDRELLSVISRRLSDVEGKLKKQREELVTKDRKILYQEQKIQLLENQNDKPQNESVNFLTQQCESLQNKIREMEDFLYDYGLVWVGETQIKDTKEEAVKDTTEVCGASMWCPEDSVSQASTKLNYDLIIANIKELNLLAGEGVAKVEQTEDGAKLKYPESATLTLYRNGIILMNGPFRPLTDPATRRCLYDIMEGFFPSELQSTYPEGVPLMVIDQRNNNCVSQLTNSFPGPGKILNSFTNDTSTGLHLTSSTNMLTFQTPQHPQIMTQPHEPRLTADQFVRKLPVNVIRNGKIIEVQKPIENLLKSTESPKRRQLTIIETLVKNENNVTPEPLQHDPGIRDIANIQVKSETGDCKYLLKMNYMDTIGDLRSYLDAHRPADSPAYQILSTFPRRVLGDLAATIEDCELIPTATLVLEPVN